jgi:hypothetical protein
VRGGFIGHRALALKFAGANDDERGIMGKDWIDRKNSIFAAQARTFSKTLNLDPSAYGVSSADAALLAADCAAYMVLDRRAEDPATRVMGTVNARNEARDRLAAGMRTIADRIRADRSISGAARIALGMTPPRAARAAAAAGRRTSAPASRPSVLVRRAVADLVTISLRDAAEPALRGKPAQFNGALLFTYAAPAGAVADAQPPADPDAWRFAGVTTSGRATIKLRPLPPGSQVWVCARWFNGRGIGPVSLPAPSHVTSALTVYAAHAA